MEHASAGTVALPTVQPKASGAGIKETGHLDHCADWALVVQAGSLYNAGRHGPGHMAANQIRPDGQVVSHDNGIR
jgi:hypothetical protein